MNLSVRPVAGTREPAAWSAPGGTTCATRRR